MYYLQAFKNINKYAVNILVYNFNFYDDLKEQIIVSL